MNKNSEIKSLELVPSSSSLRQKRYLERVEERAIKKQKLLNQASKTITPLQLTNDSSDPPSDLVNETKRREECFSNIQKIEKETNFLKEKLFSEKLAALKREMRLLASGDHEQLKEALKPLQESLKQKIRLAKQKKRHSKNTVRVTFESDAKQADLEFESERKEVLAELKNNIERKRKEMEDEKSSFQFSTGNIRTSARIRKRTLANASKQKEEKKVPELVLELEHAQIIDDLKSIQRLLNYSSAK
eukprot:TRINITY_DN6456_c0_g1_i1.p1 TRINITY_DN6456_c0_g1~~TRINITY_DN6456_c0_g1_i1.p1  ORF type:complete len:246 (-),score=34.56 TRINITY_DN6456_c0_g1_i1:64-801(-)